MDSQGSQVHQLEASPFVQASSETTRMICDLPKPVGQQ